MNQTEVKKTGKLVSKDVILFSHIPKTAGSTLNAIIEENYDDNSIFSFYPQKQPEGTNIKNWVDEFNNSRKSSKENSFPKLVRGHFGLGIHEHLNLNSCTYITVLRSPVERVISNYYFFARPTIDFKPITEETTLESFVNAKKHKIIDNYQTRFLSGLGWQRGLYVDTLYSSKYVVKYGDCTEEMLEIAKKNLDRYVLFGLQDRFVDSLRLFKRVLKWKNIQTNKSKNVGANKPERDTISPEVIQMINEENKFDRELYEYAVKTFDTQLENLKLTPKLIDSKIVWLYPRSLRQSKNKKQASSSKITIPTDNNPQISKDSKQKLSEGDRFFDIGDYSQAINKYKEVIAENSEYILALNKLASCYIKSNDEIQAISVFKRIIEINPQQQATHAKLARLLAKQGLTKEAIKEYKSAISLEPEQPDWVFVGLSKALQKEKKDESA